MKTKPKPPVKHRKQYKLNWHQIYTKLKEARGKIVQGFAASDVIDGLDEAIEAMRERMYS